MQVLMRMDPRLAPNAHFDMFYDEDADEYILSFVNGAISVNVVLTEDRLAAVARTIARHCDQPAAKRREQMVKQMRAERRANGEPLRCGGPGCGVVLTREMGLIVGVAEDTVFCSARCRDNRAAEKRRTAPVGEAVR